MITISGVDGSGKSTQARLLAERLIRQGKRCELIWFRPGYSRGLDLLRATIRQVRPSTLPTVAQASSTREAMFRRPWVRKGWIGMALADTLAQYAVRIRLLSSVGRVVICDRCLHDGALDLELRFPGEWRRAKELYGAVARLCPTPACSIALMLPHEEALRRRAAKVEPFPDPPEIAERRFLAYEELVANGTVQPVDGLGTVDEVHDRVVAALERGGVL